MGALYDIGLKCVSEEELDMRDLDAGEAIGFDLVLSESDALGHPLSRRGWNRNATVDRDGRSGCLFLAG